MSKLAWRCGGVLTLLVIAGAGAHGQDDKEQTKGPLRRMQGEWSFTLAEGTSGTFVFKGETVTVSVGDRKYVAKTTADRRAEPHPTIDFEITEGPDDSVGKKVLGIYKFDGAKKLTICTGHPDGDRPTELKADEGQTMLFELERKGDD
jgi:uncharacterized protein (TIGR03067 family)